MSLLRKVEYRTREQLEASSPSLKAWDSGNKVGLHVEAVKKLQALGAKLIQAVGQQLQLPVNVLYTAIFYYHRFYAVQAFQIHDRLQVATACLFLAGKVEECPRPLKLVIQMVYSHRFRKFPDLRRKIMQDMDTFAIVKDRILVVERSLLYTVGFDFNVEQPFTPIIELANMVQHFLDFKFKGVDHDKERQDVLQCAWNFALDSMRLNVCLQFSPTKIATVCIYLSVKALSQKHRKEDYPSLVKLFSNDKPFYKTWTDLLNYVKVDSYVKGDGLADQTTVEKVRAHQMKKRREEYLLSYDEIYKLLPQITSMYKESKAEEGEISQDLVKKETKEEGKNANGKRPAQNTEEEKGKPDSKNSVKLEASEQETKIKDAAPPQKIHKVEEPAPAPAKKEEV